MKPSERRCALGMVAACSAQFPKSLAVLRPLLRRIARTDRLIDFIVYRLYGLTEEEVAAVEGTRQ